MSVKPGSVCKSGEVAASTASASAFGSDGELSAVLLSLLDRPSAVVDAAGSVKAALASPASSTKLVKEACAAVGVFSRSAGARMHMAETAPLLLVVLRRHEADAAVVRAALDAVAFLAVDSTRLHALAGAGGDCAATVVSAIRRHVSDEGVASAGTAALSSLSQDAAVCERLRRSDALPLVVAALQKHALSLAVTAQGLQALCNFVRQRECSTAQLTSMVPLQDGGSVQIS